MFTYATLLLVLCYFFREISYKRLMHILCCRLFPLPLLILPHTQVISSSNGLLIYFHTLRSKLSPICWSENMISSHQLYFPVWYNFAPQTAIISKILFIDIWSRKGIREYVPWRKSAEEEQEEGHGHSQSDSMHSRTMHIVFAHIIYFSLYSFHLRINLF